MPELIEVRNLRTGGVGRLEVPTADEARAAALLRERAGYLVRKLPERVAAVDVELQRLGVDPTQPAPSTSEPVRGAADERDRQGHRRRGRQPAGGAAAAGRR